MSENRGKCLKSGEVTITQLTPVKLMSSELNKDPSGMIQVSRNNKYIEENPLKVIVKNKNSKFNKEMLMQFDLYTNKLITFKNPLKACFSNKKYIIQSKRTRL